MDNDIIYVLSLKGNIFLFDKDLLIARQTDSQIVVCVIYDPKTKAWGNANRKTLGWALSVTEYIIITSHNVT